MTENSQNCRPLGHEEGRTFLTVEEVSEMLRVSQWTTYNLIKTDPTFPYLNIGLKKKLVIDRARLEVWMQARTNLLFQQERSIPSGTELLKAGGE